MFFKIVTISLATIMTIDFANSLDDKAPIWEMAIRLWGICAYVWLMKYIGNLM